MYQAIVFKNANAEGQPSAIGRNGILKSISGLHVTAYEDGENVTIGPITKTGVSSDACLLQIPVYDIDAVISALKAAKKDARPQSGEEGSGDEPMFAIIVVGGVVAGVHALDPKVKDATYIIADEDDHSLGEYVVDGYGDRDTFVEMIEADWRTVE